MTFGNPRPDSFSSKIPASSAPRNILRINPTEHILSPIRDSHETNIQLGTKHMIPPGGATSKRRDGLVSCWWRRLEVPCVLSGPVSYWWRRLEVPCVLSPAVDLRQKNCTRRILTGNDGKSAMGYPCGGALRIKPTISLMYFSTADSTTRSMDLRKVKVWCCTLAEKFWLFSNRPDYKRVER